jgi:hypothetical protein
MRRRMARFMARVDPLLRRSKRSAGRKTRPRGGSLQMLRSCAHHDALGIRSNPDRNTIMRTRIKVTTNTGQL